MTLVTLLLGVGQASEVRAEPPDVLALVFSPGAGNDRISVKYAAPVADAEMARDAMALARTGRWQPINRRHTRDSMSSGFGFEAPGLVSRAAGTVPLTPFVEAFKRFRRLRVIFAVAGNFVPRPWSNVKEPGCEITMERHGTNLNFDIVIRDHTSAPRQVAHTLGEPVPQGEGGTDLLWAVVVLFLSTGVLTALAMVLMELRAQRRRRLQHTRT